MLHRLPLALLALLLLGGCDLDPPHPPRVLVVGLDGGDWDVIDVLVESGHLPAVGALVAAGARADLDCEPAWPAFSCYCPPVWSTIFTGQPASVHGMRAVEDGPPARRVKAIWTVNGERGGVNALASVRNSFPFEDEVSWGLSEPGLDDAALQLYAAWGGPAPQPEPWTLTRPWSLLERLGLLPPTGERRPAWLPMARDRVMMDAMFPVAFLTRFQSRLLRAPELVVLTFHSPDKSSHVDWGSIQAVPNGPIDAAALRLKAKNWTGPVFVPAPYGFGSVASQYLEADRWLGDFLAVYDFDYVVLASDHGFGRNPGPGLSGLHGSVAPEAHRGIFSVTGPGVRAGAETEATVLDVTPTLAYLLRLPVAEDLPGRVLVEVLTPGKLEREPVETVPTWEADWWEGSRWTVGRTRPPGISAAWRPRPHLPARLPGPGPRAPRA